MKETRSIERKRALGLAAALTALSAVLSACNTNGELTTAAVPEDYRLRHPIAVEEGNQSIVVFVGQGRGGLSASQYADVMGLARSWVREATGAIVADVPVDTPNARAAAATLQEIQRVLATGGVPARGLTVHRYRPDDPRFFATIRLSYPKIKAVAGPCGMWPADLGASVLNPDYFENRPYYNLGCATQRNLAAMIDNPADLEQPRSETYAYTPRRTAAFERYRKGEPTTTNYPEADKAKLSDTGK
jgi:pilus assembly protein CpaD